MPDWWDSLASKKQYPFVPLEPESDDGPFWAVVLLFVGFAGFAASLVGLFVQGWSISGWALPIAMLSFIASIFLLRDRKPRR